MLKRLLHSISAYFSRSQSVERVIVALAASAGLTALLMSLDFNLLEAKLYDFRMSRGPQPAPSSNIVLVALDDASTDELQEFSPLPLESHLRLFEKLEAAEPKAVGYLIDLNQIEQMSPEQLQGPTGAKFLETVNRIEGRGTVVLFGTPYDITGESQPPAPLERLAHSIAVIHKDGFVFAEDKVTRRAITHLRNRPAFHLELAQRLGYLPYGQEPRGSFTVPEIDSGYFFFRYHGNPSLNGEGSGDGEAGPFPATSDESEAGNQPIRSNYPIYSFADVLAGRVDPALLREKIILVGTLSRDNSADFANTPYSRNSFASPKLSIHATILDSIIRDDGLLRSSATLNWVATFTVVLLVFAWVLGSTPMVGVFATLGLGFGFFLFCYLAFRFEGLWIRASQPMVGIFVGYYLVVPYRLIREYKKRWEYQRKNELLTQVEELKSNFLNLVTHDLKTPVARIQGLAEVILREGSAASGEPAATERNLRHIISSTDELNRFISSILELSKVESKNLVLRRESKDINQLIERSLEGFQAQARAAGIELVAQLEPLFPIRIDFTLMAKVINNLIDNAIKYSSKSGERGKRVTVSSREVGTEVEIAVADQGIGMTVDEQNHLFTRFYRAKNDTTTQVAGTGLGLYLTKFFIEAHQGRVEVESVAGQGTTFRIYLPTGAAEVVGDGAPRARPGLLTRLRSFTTPTETIAPITKENPDV